MRHALAFSALALMLAACATSSGPAPLVIGGASSAASQTTIQKIGQCDPAFPDALIDYPRGWNDRLARVEETAVPNAEDELLGGAPSSRPASVTDRDAQPLSPPRPSYPKAALKAQQEGACQALFDVTEAGKPVDILVACTAPDFAAATRDAVASLDFAPVTVDGSRVARRNVIYPLTYCFE